MCRTRHRRVGGPVWLKVPDLRPLIVPPPDRWIGLSHMTLWPGAVHWKVFLSPVEEVYIMVILRYNFKTSSIIRPVMKLVWNPLAFIFCIHKYRIQLQNKSVNPQRNDKESIILPRMTYNVLPDRES